MNLLCLPVLVGCLLALLAGTSGVEFTQFQLYVVHVDNRDQLNQIQELVQNGDYDFWDVPRVNRKARVMVNHVDEIMFEKFLEEHDIDFDPLVENVQQILNKERKTNEEHHRRAKRDAGAKVTVDFDHYWTLDEIYAYIEELAATSEMVTAFDIGTTHEGRPIKAMTISRNGEVAMDRPVVFMDAGIHAREWAGIMSVLYMIHEFVEHSEQYPDQLDNTDYVIIPVLNPDGYVYTHEKNRLWRKNRVQNNLLCAGVDVNRNFPAMWRFTSNACTNSYAGPEHSSEKETVAMMGLMDRYKSAMAMYVAVHTHGDMILWPWGYEYDKYCDNWEEHDQLGKLAQQAIVAVGGPEWEVGNSVEVLNYRASGATDDYAYATGARLAFTIELTGGGYEGFDLPADQIGKVSRETMEVYKVFGKHAGSLTVPIVKN